MAERVVTFALLALIALAIGGGVAREVQQANHCSRDLEICVFEGANP